MTANASQFGRADYDSTIRVRSIPADEPRFLLRAQDEVAAEAIRLWVWLAAKRGVSPAILELALKQADAMEEWPTHKLPDAGDLTEAQVKQLTFEFDRRAQRAGVDLAPDEALKLLLAERRGYRHALNAVRVMYHAVGIAAKLVRGDLEERTASNDPGEDQAAARVKTILNGIDSALLVGSRALARSGAQPLCEDDADWLRRQEVELAELDIRIKRLRAEQTAEKEDRNNYAPKRAPGPLATTMIVSVFGSGVWVIGYWAQAWLLGWTLTPLFYGLGLVLAVVMSNVASTAVDLHLWRASLKRPVDATSAPVEPV